MNTAVANIYNPAILVDGCKLTESGKYSVPVEALESVEA